MKLRGLPETKAVLQRRVEPFKPFQAFYNYDLGGRGYLTSPTDIANLTVSMLGIGQLWRNYGALRLKPIMRGN